VLQRPLPELADWLAQAAQANPQLRALQARLDASVAAKTAARAATQPTLRGELEAYAYTKDLSGRDELRASLVLQVPLVTGGRVDAAVAEREAERQTALAQLHQQQLAVRQALTEHWLAIQGLRAEQTALQTGMTYRDLYLDRSRARYEQEVQADLGDAMVQISAQQLRLAQNEYAQLLTWARIDALLGKTALDPAQTGEAEHESAK
jgi:outer membrane protein TolC